MHYIFLLFDLIITALCFGLLIVLQALHYASVSCNGSYVCKN